MHIVHQKENSTDLIVLAVLFQAGDNYTNHFLDQLTFLDPPVEENEQKRVQGIVNLQNILSLIQPEFYVYQGSLTFVPCSENVNWRIYKTVQFMSTEQLMEYRRAFPLKNNDIGNNRLTQPVNDRIILDVIT